MKEGIEMAKKQIYLMVADVTGDTRMVLEWDPKNPEDVKEMKARFLEYRKKGYIFYECKGFLGKYKPKGKPVKDFDKSTKVLIGEKHFDDLKKILKDGESASFKAEEVILTDTVSDTEETVMFDPETEEPKDGTTYGAVNMVSGG